MTTPDRDELATLLRAEREEPDPRFAEELDRWAAAGFPRAERPGAPKDRRPGLLQRLSLPRARTLATAGAVCTVLVVIGIGVSQLETTGSNDAATGVGAAQNELDSPSAAGGGADSAAAPANKDVQPAQTLEDGAGGEAALSQRQAAPEPDSPARGRKIAQDVDLVLATEPDGIREVSDGVNEVVNRYRGFVTNSSVQSGDANQTPGATFQLRLPARTLQDSLGALSELAHVQSRTEATRDITQRFTSAEERITDAETARRAILRRLEDATTESEIAALRAQLRGVNAQLAAARSDLAQATQRVQLVPVAVSVIAEEGADDGPDGDWSIGDAIDDAGDVLSTAAGIFVVAGAVLLPLALVGALVAVAMRARASRGRERALDT